MRSRLAQPLVLAILAGCCAAACAMDPPRGPASATAPTMDTSAPGCRPEWPALAMRAHAQGVTHLRFATDEQGHVTHGEILGPSGRTRAHQLMDDAARQALARCPVRPARDDRGKPVGGVVTVAWNWTFGDDGPATLPPGEPASDDAALTLRDFIVSPGLKRLGPSPAPAGTPASRAGVR